MTPAELAISNLATRARRSDATDRERVVASLALDGPGAVDELSAGFLRASRLTVNFHPDRRVDDRVVAASIADAGRYLSQYATGISNGSRSAIPGGLRTHWERELFGDGYDDAPPADRPIFGVLDPLNDVMGGSPHFGSCHLTLADHVIDRATFCVGDSHLGPTDVGTAGTFTSILAGLAEQAVEGRLLARDLGVDDLRALTRGERRKPTSDRRLESYVEAQIHGGVSLGDDVVGLSADPAYRGTPIESHLERIASAAGVEITWHVGSELAATDFPRDFRGRDLPELAAIIARADGIVDAVAVGQYIAGFTADAPQPHGDDAAAPLQRVKHLWQSLVVFGHDRVTGR